MKPSQVQVGMLVTCKVAEKAYCPSAAVFQPGMRGVVVHTGVPKVRIVPGEGRDQLDIFVVVDFELDGRTHRTGLNYSNVLKAR